MANYGSMWLEETYYIKLEGKCIFFFHWHFSQFSEAGEDVFDHPGSQVPSSDRLGRKRMSFLVVHDISDSSPYAILKVPESATTKDVIKQAVIKGGE